MKCLPVVCLTLFGLLLLSAVRVDSAPEICGFWADAFHTGFRNAAQVDQMVADVRAANCNTIFVQVRRRGDVYYSSAYEPWASDSGGPSFDALDYLIQKAHTGSPRLDVHAWVVIGAVHSSQNTPPSSPNHVFNKHPEFLTQDFDGETWDGSNYWIDLGHPGSADYHIQICKEIITNYDIDGFHLDRIRLLSKEWGYNPVSVSRFNAKYSRTGVPSTNDSDWKQWRRDQISSFVRRLYLESYKLKPDVKISGALNTRAPGITTTAQWPTSAAYSDTMQDWRAWMEEGILDIACPMTYMDEDTHGDVWDKWTQFTKDHQYNRMSIAGQGTYLNTVDDSLSQIRTTRLPSPSGNYLKGVSLYSYAETNDNDPLVSRSDFIQALVNAPNAYDPSPSGVFLETASVPDLPWKSSPTKGHLFGRVTKASDATAVETTINLTGPSNQSIGSDGNGYFGFVDLSPGNYLMQISVAGFQPVSQALTITPGVLSERYPQLSVLISPLVISNLAASATALEATINWETDQPSDSRVRFGSNPALLTAGKSDTLLKTHHSLNIAGILPGKRLFYQVSSTSLSGAATDIVRWVDVPAWSAPEVIVDNPAATFTGVWTPGTSASGKYGADYQYATARTTETAVALWSPDIPWAGNYDVFIQYPAGSNRTEFAPFQIYHQNGIQNATVNQKLNGGVWFKLADNLPFAVGSAGYVRLGNNTGVQTGVVMADAVRLLYDGTTPDVRIGTVKLQPDGYQASLIPKTVSAVFNGFFYIQETDSSSAIRVQTAAGIQAGDLVNITGTLSTLPTGERYILPFATTKSGEGASLNAMMLQTESVSIHAGLDNTGLLIALVGYIQQLNGAYYLNDGGASPIRLSGFSGPALPGVLYLVKAIASRHSLTIPSALIISSQTL